MQGKEKLMLYNLSPGDAAVVKKLADNMRIKVIEVSESQYGCSLGEVYDGKPADTGAQPILGSTPSASLLVMANLTEKHMDSLLYNIRSNSLGIDYKAVLTDTNRTWNVARMMFEMEKEKRLFYAY